ncbi:hypothetical protein [Jeotgalibacillus aurantiacus]|uniref:hypothetical protein n=1 Tax=Jeotgalibacillus aurantiacus TaxID=2763266 RepID=UPI001D09A722|nr:hypothetical protein [Jeotgalibacillus aurantiacus]
MKKTVTFSFETENKAFSATETFPLEELGVDEGLLGEALQQKLEDVFQQWMMNKLNVSYSIVVDEEKV